MNLSILKHALLAACALPASLLAQDLQPAATSSLELASPFGEHMVLQRRMPIPVWGWSTPGDKITVTLAGATAIATTSDDGRWRCELPPIEAGGPYTFKATNGETEIRFHDVLAGEVWICCGQSNMQMGHGGIPEIAALVEETIAEKRPVRTLQVSQNISFLEEERARTEWSTTPPNSAVAAAFACKLQASTEVPVAMVVAAWGSSSLEGWMPGALTKELPHFKKLMDEHLADTTITDLIIAANADRSSIGKYSADPDENAAFEKKYRNANIYARTRPNMLYNAMLHPLIPMATQGMVYYQGEANGGTLESMLLYGNSQRVWLELLRQRWERDDWKFMSVMLPGFSRIEDLEAVDVPTWSTIRDQQLDILELPHTAVACTIDLGDAKDIHPKDKLPIGERLALLARRDCCGETDLLAQGPTFAKMEKVGLTLTIQFEHAQGLTTSDGEPPKAFWVSDGADQWHRANARIEGETIILTAPDGVAPKHVRYAYAAKPEVNLTNEAGLPAYPFTTD